MMRTLAVLAALSLAVGAGCASKYKPQTATWGQVEDETRGERETKVEVDTSKMTAAEVAATFATGAECEYEARKQYGKSPKLGITLLAACLKRSDFLVLDIFWADPWAKLFKDPNRYIEIARVVSNRGGTVDTDLEKLQQNRVPVFSVEQALEKAAQTKGRYVLARGLYKGLDKEKPDLRLFEQTVVDTDAAGEQALDDGRLPAVGAPTGVMLRVEPAHGEDTPGLDEEYVLIGEMVDLEEAVDDETGEDQQVIGLKSLIRLKPYAYLR